MQPSIFLTVVFAGLVSGAVDAARGAVDAVKSGYELGKAIATGDIDLYVTIQDQIYQIIDVFLNQIIEGILGIVGLVFTYGTRYFLFFENPVHIDALNEYWMDTLPLYVAIILVGFMTYYPVMMLLADDDQADIDRIVQRLILSAFLLFISRELLGFFINFTHTIAFGILPNDFSFHVVFSSFETINTAVAGVATSFGVALVSSIVGGGLIVSGMVFYLVLAVRMLIVYTLYGMFPVFAGLWVIDVGPAKYGKTLADFAFKISGVLIVMAIVVSAVLTVGIGVANDPASTASFASDYDGGASDTVVLSTDELGPQSTLSQGEGGSFDTRSVSEMLFTMFIYLGSIWIIIALFLSAGGIFLSAGASSPGGMGGTHGSAGSGTKSPTSHHPAASSNPDDGVWGGRYGDTTSGTAYSQQLDDGRYVLANPAGGGVIVNPDAPMNADQFDGVADQRFESFTPEENPLADEDVAPNPFQDPDPVQWGDRASNIGGALRKKASDMVDSAKEESDVAAAASSMVGDAASKTAGVAESATAGAAEAGAERLNQSDRIDRDLTSDVESAKETYSDAKEKASSVKSAVGDVASDFISDPISTADSHLSSHNVAATAATLSEAKQQYSEFSNQKLSDYMNGLHAASDKFQSTRVGGYTMQAAGWSGSLMRRGAETAYSIHKQPSIESSFFEAKRSWLSSNAHEALSGRVPGVNHEPVNQEHRMEEGIGAYELGREYAHGPGGEFTQYPDDSKKTADVDGGIYPSNDAPMTGEEHLNQQMEQAPPTESYAEEYELNPTTDKPPYGTPDTFQGRDPDLIRGQDGYGPDPQVDGINGAHHNIRAESAKNVAESVAPGSFDDISVNDVYGQINHEMQHLESVVSDYDAALDMSREEIGAMLEYQGELGVPADVAVKRTAEAAINHAADPVNELNTSEELLEEFGVEDIPESLATDAPVRRINLDKEGVNTSTAGDVWRVERNDGSVVYEQANVNKAGVNAIKTEAVMTQLGLDVPQHHFNPVNGTLRVEGLQGDTLAEVLDGNSSLDPSDIDTDSLVDAYAAMGITGHDDVNSGNLVVQDDGSVVPVNFDRAGGNVTDTEPLSIEKAEEVADQLGADVDKHDVKQRMKEMAGEFVDAEDVTSEKIVKKLPDADANPDQMLVDHYSDSASPQQLDRDLKNKRKQGIEETNELVNSINDVANGDADWQYSSPRSTGSRPHNLSSGAHTAQQTSTTSQTSHPSNDTTHTRPVGGSDSSTRSGSSDSPYSDSSSASSTGSSDSTSSRSTGSDSQSVAPTRSDRVSEEHTVSSEVRSSSVEDDVKDYDLQSSTPSPSSSSSPRDRMQSMTTDEGIHAQVEDTMDAYTSDLDKRDL